jgi:hypothetical protein
MHGSKYLRMYDSRFNHLTTRLCGDDESLADLLMPLREHFPVHRKVSFHLQSVIVSSNRHHARCR